MRQMFAAAVFLSFLGSLTPPAIRGDPPCCCFQQLPRASFLASSKRREFVGFNEVDESCVGDVEEELQLVFDDSPRTTKRTYFSVI